MCGFSQVKHCPLLYKCKCVAILAEVVLQMKIFGLKAKPVSYYFCSVITCLCLLSSPPSARQSPPSSEKLNEKEKLLVIFSFPSCISIVFSLNFVPYSEDGCVLLIVYSYEDPQYGW